eukprot:TRINITY_DN13151_c0_g1_i1.p1 TRINITY_DN13151_c0_g1~~TRINITY_DN13151_c0_g1_i1.p1  ORF type:complete len:1785 (-),score=511.60 TRINITY_DN13151_c0_g1_i1:502-5856(-)
MANAYDRGFPGMRPTTVGGEARRPCAVPSLPPRPFTEGAAASGGRKAPASRSGGPRRQWLNAAAAVNEEVIVGPPGGRRPNFVPLVGAKRKPTTQDKTGSTFLTQPPRSHTELSHASRLSAEFDCRETLLPNMTEEPMLSRLLDVHALAQSLRGYSEESGVPSVLLVAKILQVFSSLLQPQHPAFGILVKVVAHIELAIYSISDAGDCQFNDTVADNALSPTVYLNKKEEEITRLMNEDLDLSDWQEDQWAGPRRHGLMVQLRGATGFSKASIKRSFCVCSVPGKPAAGFRTQPAQVCWSEARWQEEATIHDFSLFDCLMFHVYAEMDAEEHRHMEDHAEAHSSVVGTACIEGATLLAAEELQSSEISNPFVVFEGELALKGPASMRQRGPSTSPGSEESASSRGFGRVSAGSRSSRHPSFADYSGPIFNNSRAPSPAPPHTARSSPEVRFEAARTEEDFQDTHLRIGVRIVVLRAGGAAAQVLPHHCIGRVPYFIVVKMQKQRLRKLQERCDYLTKIISQAVKCSFLKSTVMQVSWRKSPEAETFERGESKDSTPPSVYSTPTPKKQSANAKLASDALNAYAPLLLLLAMGYWKLFLDVARRNNRRKKTLVLETLVGDLRKPFACWRIFVKELAATGQRLTLHAFVLEKQILTVQVDDLREQQDNTQIELELSQHSTKALEERLQGGIRARELLAQRLEAAKPEAVKSMLCSVLNLVFQGVIREAGLLRSQCRRCIMTRDLAVLLQESEDNTVKLQKLSPDGFMLRWINYHLMEFKRLVATKVLDAMARNRDQGQEHGSGFPSEWAQREAETYGDRCKIVRSQQRIFNLTDDVKDGSVLTVLYAVLSCTGDSQKSLSPAGLWVLDERDLEQRAVKLHSAMQLILPTKAAQCIFTPQDLSRTNTPVLMIMLAALFLHGCMLPSSIPPEKVFDYVGAVVPAKRNGEQAASGVTEAEAAAAAAAEQERLEAPAKIDPTNRHALTMVEGIGSHVCFYENLQDVSILAEDEEKVSDLLRMTASEFLLRWINHQLPQKPNYHIRSWSDLKKSKELLFDLVKATAGDVLSLVPDSKKVLQAQEAKEKVERQEREAGGKEGKESKDGKEAKDKDTKDVGAPAARDEKAEEALLVDVLLQCGMRCSNYEILTKSALLEGHTDVLAAFVAALFLCRPNLNVVRDSPLQEMVNIIDTTVHKASKAEGGSKEPGQEQQAGSSGDFDKGAEFSERLLWFQATRGDFNKALTEVRKANDLYQSMSRKSRTFLADLLSQRCQGSPAFLEEEQEEAAHRSDVLPQQVLDGLICKETNCLDKAELEVHRISLEAVMRKHVTLFRELFQYYAHRVSFGEEDEKSSQRGQASPQTRQSLSRKSRMTGRGTLRLQQTINVDTSHVVDLRGIARLARDCKLHTLGFHSGDIEAIFLEVKEEEPDGQAWSSKVDPRLKIRGFAIGGLFAFAVKIAYRCGVMSSDISDALSVFIERYVWPFARRAPQDIFEATAYSASGLTACLPKLDGILRKVFDHYSTDDPDKLGKAPESGYKPPSPVGGGAGVSFTSAPPVIKKVRRLAFEDLETLLLRGNLAENKGLAQLRRIVLGVTTPRDAADEPSDSDGSDSDTDSKDNRKGSFASDCSIASRQDPERRSSIEQITSAARRFSTVKIPKEGPRAARKSMAVLKKELEGDVNVEGARSNIYFMEFIDVLAAIVMYRDPNPFTPFSKRFEDAIKKLFLKNLVADMREYENEKAIVQDLDDFLIDKKASEKKDKKGAQTKQGLKVASKRSARRPSNVDGEPG